MIDWLQTNQTALSIRGIEKLIGMPYGTLTKAVNESRKLPPHWEEPLRSFISNLQEPILKQ